MTLATLTLFHALCTLAMTGIVWFVQVVHYPLFAWLDGADGPRYAVEHQRRTTWLVAPVMVGEAAAACGLLIVLRSTEAEILAIAGLVLLVLVWLSTALWQVPLHARLAQGARPEDVSRLVRTNWVRTAAWTARSIIALALLRMLMSGYSD